MFDCTFVVCCVGSGVPLIKSLLDKAFSDISALSLCSILLNFQACNLGMRNDQDVIQLSAIESGGATSLTIDLRLRPWYFTNLSA